MRHHNNKRKFGRDKNGKRALLNSLILNLILREKIKTTEAKAKELRPYAEKLVTRAKKNDLASRRLIASKLMNRNKEIKKLIQIASKYSEKKGGYTRITKLGIRKSDGASMALIEFV